MPRLNRHRVAHKSTGGILHSIPEPVDPVGNAPSNLRLLTSNTVASRGSQAVSVRLLELEVADSIS